MRTPERRWVQPFDSAAAARRERVLRLAATHQRDSRAKNSRQEFCGNLLG